MVDFNTDDNNIRFIIESAFTKLEKANFRLWVAVIILILSLLGTNIAWIAYEMSWQYVESSTQTVTQEAQTDGDGSINLQNIGGDYYGNESKANSD